MRFGLLLLAVAVAASVGYGATSASALSCRGPWWNRSYSEVAGEDPDDWRASLPSEPVPIDVRLWEFRGCAYELEPCSFVSEQHTVEVDREPLSECPGWPAHGAIAELVPREPLLAGVTYENRCVASLPTFTTREGSASAPEPLQVEAVGLDRRSDGPCSSGDALDIVLADLDAAYLREGGYIELAYPKGHVLPITERTYGQPEGFPETDGPITLTPVAADGRRGEAVRVEKIRYNQAVHTLCAVGEHAPGQALWSLVPVAYLLVARRRRAR